MLKMFLVLVLVMLVGCTTADKTKKVTVLKKTDSKEVASVKKSKRILIWLDTGDFAIDKTLENLIYLAFEEEATGAKVKYLIISQDVRDAAIEAIKIEQGWEQNDPRFLPKLKRQLAANFFGRIKVLPMFSKGDANEGKLFRLINKFSNIEKAYTLVASSLSYMPGQTENEYNTLFNKFKQLAHEFFEKTDSKFLDGTFDNSYKLNTPNVEKVEKVEKEEKVIDKIEKKPSNVDEINSKTIEKSKDVAPGW